jgi:hypothetical protein
MNSLRDPLGMCTFLIGPDGQRLESASNQVRHRAACDNKYLRTRLR